MISVIIPTTKSEVIYLPNLIPILCESGSRIEDEYEIIIIENGVKGKIENLISKMNNSHLRYFYLSVPSRSLAKNFGVEQSKGETLIFIDADNLCSLDLLPEVYEKASNPKFFGGGCKMTRLTRYSVGIISYFLVIISIFIIWRIVNLFNPFTVGIFWIKKDAFNEIGGWKDVELKDIVKWLSFIPKSIQPADDVDLGMRMKEYEKKKKLKFESLKKTIHIWNTRKFDTYGDWHWIKGYHSPKIITDTTHR
jgi:glycosyltransferase involved in cell wall biosynthesis